MIVTDLRNSFNPAPKNKTEKWTEEHRKFDKKWTDKKEKQEVGKTRKEQI
jgi:hypothetical protein